MEIFAVFFGGGLGASLRFLISVFTKKHFNSTYWTTFLINISGCFLLSLITFGTIKHQEFSNSNFILFLTTGVTGGFTTFSTFSYENIELLKDGKVFQSLLYMTLSLAGGILGIYLGYSLNK